jgi:hypothetical protein
MAWSTSSSSASNAMEGGKQIQSDLVGFVPQPPTRLHAYANLEESMEMMFRSFRFLVEKRGSHHFSAPIFSGPLVAEPNYSGSSTSSVELGDEEVSPPHFTKPADCEKLTDLFGEMTFGLITKTDLSQDSDSESFINFDFANTTNSTASMEVFADLYDGITYPEFDENASTTYRQICVITGSCCEADEEFEAFGDLGNPYVDPADLTRGTSIKYVGAQPREKVQLPQAAWDRATRAINGTEPMTTQADGLMY